MAKHQPSVSKLEDLKPGTEWHSVPGFPRYWITKEGLVSYQDDAGRFRLKAIPVTQSGHRLVGLTNGSVKRSVNLLRLMAEVFIGQAPEGYRWVLAKDGNIENVTVGNVSWSAVNPSKGKAKATKLSSAEKTSVALKLVTSDVASVARETGLPLTYVRHLTPGAVYKERVRSSPDDVSRQQFTPPADESVEEWRAIADAPGYDVSSFGRVRSWRGRQPAVCKQQLDSQGYLKLVMQLGSKGSTKQSSVHRLVALAFCRRAHEDHKVVNHKDGNKLNNYFSNLEWVTHSENMKHAHSVGLWQKTEGHGQRWSRPPVVSYDLVRAGRDDGWHPAVVSALRQGLGWADQTPGSLPDEVWCPVYDRWSLATPLEVSSLGRVRRASGHATINQSLSTHGYPVVQLYTGKGNGTSQRTHMLVAESFLGPRPSSRHVVNHKDGNKQNNNVSNLEWVTYADNSKHWAASRA